MSGELRNRDTSAADLAFLHHPLQCIRPEWSTMACTDPAESRTSRTRLVEEHADSDTLIMPAHFPDPTAGWIRRHNGSYRFAFRE